MPALTLGPKQPVHPSDKAVLVIGHLMIVAASTALIWLCQGTLYTCFGVLGGCGTPCATTSFALLFAPLLLTLPFIKLLTAKGLTLSGLIARCAVTSGIGVWVLANLLIQFRSSFL